MISPDTRDTRTALSSLALTLAFAAYLIYGGGLDAAICWLEDQPGVKEDAEMRQAQGR